MEAVPDMHEKSAGGIVYRRKNNELEILMLAWRNAKQELEYVLPKGKMEDTESAMQTALREISEETGLVIGDLDIIKFLSTIEYSYYANHIEGSPIVHKEVHLYLVKYRGKKEPRPPIKERFFGYKWFSLAGMKNLHLKPDVVGFIEKNIHFMG